MEEVMTVIAGFTDYHGNAAIASDSQATAGDSPHNFGPKLAKGNGFLVGIAGVASVLQAVQLAVSEYIDPLTTKGDVTKFAQWIKKVAIAAGVNEDYAGEFAFVLVTKSAAWQGMSVDLVLPGKNGIAACGSGGVHATTVMKYEYKASGGDIDNAGRFVHDAVAAAIEQSITCGGDIYVEVL